MTSTLPNQQPIQSPMDDNSAYDQKFFDVLQKFSQNRPQQSAYEEALRNVPTRSDYAPSIGRRIAAGIAGAGAGIGGDAAAGMAAGQHIAEQPYNYAMSDYATRLAGYERAAEMEDKQIGQSLQNIGTAAQYQSSNRAYNANQHWKQIEAQQKEEDLDIRGFTADTGRQGVINQGKRFGDQTANEQTDNAQNAIRDRNTRDYQQGQLGIGGRRADAAAVAAEAARTRAGRAGSNQTPRITEKDARDLVLEEMYSDPDYKGMITVNQGDFGPTFTLNPNVDRSVLREIQGRIRKKLTASYPSYSPGDDTEEDEEDPDDDLMFGDIVIPGGR